MLALFSCETENGKLYVSYPMVEANRHVSKDENFNDSVFHVANGSDYKRIVDLGSSAEYKHVKKFDRARWIELIEKNLEKANRLFCGASCFPTPSDTFSKLGQNRIFEVQVEKFVLPHGLVAILGSFPFFIVEYFGEKLFSEFPSLAEVEVGA